MIIVKKYNCENTKIETDNYNTGLEQGYIEGYLAGSEPREKRITILEQQIEKMKNYYEQLLDEKIELENKLAKSRECY